MENRLKSQNKGASCCAMCVVTHSIQVCSSGTTQLLSFEFLKNSKMIVEFIVCLDFLIYPMEKHKKCSYIQYINGKKESGREEEETLSAHIDREKCLQSSL